MRLFIAINFNDDVKQKLVSIQDRLKENALRGNFSSYDNLHLTLLFIGEVYGDRIELLKKAMDDMTVTPFKINIQGIGSFKRDRGDIWWAGIEENRNLSALHSQLFASVTHSGVEIEKRKFAAHLTLAREVTLREGFDHAAFSQKASQIITDVTRISLMKSERINGLLKYTEIYRKLL